MDETSDERLCDLLVTWELGCIEGREPPLADLCGDCRELFPQFEKAIAALKATAWMFRAPADSTGRVPSAPDDCAPLRTRLDPRAFIDRIGDSGVLKSAEFAALCARHEQGLLEGNAAEIAMRLVREQTLTRYQAEILLSQSREPLVVDDYVILETLEHGGMGLVFKARHQAMNRVVVLKQLPSFKMKAPDQLRRFQRELKAAAALRHPNIVAAFDGRDSIDAAYLVQEYVDGVDLFRLIEILGPLSPRSAVACIRQAAAGLAYLHQRGIIHRDVKPSNLILSGDGTVKLLDMGVVHFVESPDGALHEPEPDLTHPGSVIGTVAYMAPEQALATRSVDARSDVYSLGCTLFFLLTGRTIFAESTGLEILLAHRDRPAPRLAEFCAEVPAELEHVFQKMVAKSPADRYQTMETVAEALANCCKPQVLVPLPAKRPSRPPAWRADGGLRRWVRITALAAVLVFVLWGGWTYSARSRPPLRPIGSAVVLDNRSAPALVQKHSLRRKQPSLPQVEKRPP